MPDMPEQHQMGEKTRRAAWPPIAQPQPSGWLRRLRDGLPDGVQRHFRSPLGMLQQYSPKPMWIPYRYRVPSRLDLCLPSVSIVTPSLNQGPFLERTIHSILSQAYPHLEYIIQDGGSTDETQEVLSRYAALCTSIESVADQGQAQAINRGFQHTTGEILAYLNSDDILLPGTLVYVGQFFATHPEVDVVYGHRIVINESDQEIGRWILPAPHDDAILSWGDYIPQETLFWRRRAWEESGSHIDESFQFAMDWDLLLRFRDTGARFVLLPRFLGAFRVHPRQKTSALLTSVGIPEMQRLRERCHGRTVEPAEIAQHIQPYLLKHFVYHQLYRLGVLRY